MDIVTYILARKGLELKIPNIIKNGDFSQGLDEWEPINQFNASIEITEDGAVFKARYLTYLPHQLIPIKNNHSYYISQKVKDTGQAFNAYMGFGEGPAQQQMFFNYCELLNQESFVRISTVQKANDDYTSYLPLALDSNYAEAKEILIKEILVLDLTEIFGVGNEPTREEMDTLINSVPNSWWDGNLKPKQKQLIAWLLNLIRENRDAVIALGGTI